MPATKQPFHRPAAALALAVLLAGACPLSTRADTATWASAVSGNWTDASKWSPNVVPNNDTPPETTYDVLINATGSSYTVTQNGINITLDNLTIGQNAVLSQINTLAPGVSTLTIGGILNVQNGTYAPQGNVVLADATIVCSGSGSVVSSYANFDQVTFGSGANLSVANGFIVNNLTLASDNTQFYGTLTFTGNQSITGAGKLSFAQGYFSIPTGTLTIGAGVQLSRTDSLSPDTRTAQAAFSGDTLINNGTIQSSGGTLYIQMSNFVNSGTILISGGGAGYIGKIGSPWHSTGSIVLDSTSHLILSGQYTTDDVSTIQFNGGYMELGGVLDNSNRTLTLPPGTTTLDGTITGGTIAVSGGAVLEGVGTLDGVTLAPSATPSFIATSAFESTTSTLTITNGLSFDNSSMAIDGRFLFPIDTSGSTPFTGTGTILFTGVGQIINASGTDFTLVSTMAVRTGPRGAGAYPDGMITATNAPLNNYGVISAEVPNSALALEGSQVNNFGTIQAINGGIVMIHGPLSNSGTINNNGGVIAFTASNFSYSLFSSINNQGIVAISRGTYDNTNSTFTLSAATGAFGLIDGATFSGGVISSPDDTPIHILQVPNPTQYSIEPAQPNYTPYSTMAGVTLATDMVMHPNAVLNIQNGLTLDNTTITFESVPSVPLILYPTINFSSNDSSVQGTGQIVFDTASGLGVASGGTLTLGPGIVVRTGAAGASIALIADTFPSQPTTLINQGKISAETAGQSIVLNTSNLINQGVISATNGGSVAFDGTWSNSGTISLSGGTLSLSATWTNTGKIELNDTTVILGNYDPNQVVGDFTHTGNTIFVAPVTNIAIDLSNTVFGPVDLGPYANFDNCTIGASAGTAVILAGSQVNISTSTITANLTMQPGSTIIDQDFPTNGIVLNATISMAASGTNSTVISATAISGSGRIVFDGTGSQNLLNTSLIGSGILVQAGAAGGTIASYGTVNNGTVSASTEGATIYLSGSQFTNNGLVEAKNGGAILIQASFTNAGVLSITDSSASVLGTDVYGYGTVLSNTGTIMLLNSVVSINGSLSGTGLITAENSTLTLSASTAPVTIVASNSIVDTGASLSSSFSFNGNSVTLRSGAIVNMSGATVTLSGAATSLALSGGTFENATLGNTNGASITVPNSSTLASVILNNASISVQSTLLLTNSTGGSNVQLLGTGILSFDGVANSQRISTTSATLTLGPGIEIITGNFIGSILSVQSIINQGTVSAQTLGKSISILSSLVNSNFLQAINGGSLRLSAFSSNTGEVYAGAGSLITLSPDFRGFTNHGSLLADGGSILFSFQQNTSVGLITTDSTSTLEASNSGSLVFSTGTLSVLSPISLSNASAAFDSKTQSITTITGTGFVSIGDGKSLTSDGITAASLQLGVGSTHTIRPNTGGDSMNAGASKVSTLTLAGSPGNWSSLLDLTNNALIVEATDYADKESKIATLLDEVNQARGGSANTWTGTAGITSSTVAAGDHASTGGMGLAVADAQELPNITSLSSYRGQSVDSNSIIIVAAHTGDVTLDGRIDISDLNAVTSHWQMTGALWSEGDTAGGPNGGPNGIVDIADLNAVTSFWQWGVGAGLVPLVDSQSSASSPVPEPISLTLLALAAPILLGRRKSPRN